jgi:hypothetical protein
MYGVVGSKALLFFDILSVFASVYICSKAAFGCCFHGTSLLTNI